MGTGETSLAETGSWDRKEEGKTGRGELGLAGWLRPDWQEMIAPELGQGCAHMGTVLEEMLG